MYRLTVYLLAGLVSVSLVLSLAKILPYDPWQILLPVLYLLLVCYFFNRFFASIFGRPPNHESAVITALILGLIAGPAGLGSNIFFFSFLALTAMLLKHLLVFRGRHIFNPAAVAVVLSFIVLNQGASWWVSSSHLLPLVIIFGFFLARKIGSGGMIVSFLISFFVLTALLNPGIAGSLGSVLDLIWAVSVYSPLFFFAFVMLPEPQTSPKKAGPKAVYGVAVAVFMVLLQNFLNIPYSMELSLLMGNIFAFIASRDARSSLVFKAKEEFAKGIYGFWFSPRKKIEFKPGQFLEWSIYHKGSDRGGIRRYFTIASSPTEEKILVSAKFTDNPSSFKKALMNLDPGERVTAAGPQGDFVLPDDENEKIVFVAGGIGITPMRSMAKYLIDGGLKRDIILIYAANEPEEFAFQDVFELAEKKIGLKTVYVISDKRKVPENWQGEVGFVQKEIVEKSIPDWKERSFYVSGPELMVRAVAGELVRMGIGKNRIRRDYFPGYREI